MDWLVLFEPSKFYISSSTGDLTLVEIYKTNDKVLTIIIGDSKYEIEQESAYDFADAILMMVSEDE